MSAIGIKLFTTQHEVFRYGQKREISKLIKGGEILRAAAQYGIIPLQGVEGAYPSLGGGTAAPAKIVILRRELASMT